MTALMVDKLNLREEYEAKIETVLDEFMYDVVRKWAELRGALAARGLASNMPTVKNISALPDPDPGTYLRVSNRRKLTRFPHIQLANCWRTE